MVLLTGILEYDNVECNERATVGASRCFQYAGKEVRRYMEDSADCDSNTQRYDAGICAEVWSLHKIYTAPCRVMNR